MVSNHHELCIREFRIKRGYRQLEIFHDMNKYSPDLSEFVL